MVASVTAFSDELEKIARAEAGRSASDKKRSRRALRGALSVAAGTGLGVGAGGLIAKAVDPKLTKLTPGGRKFLMGSMGALGFAGGMGREYLKRKYLQHIEGKKK